MDKKTIQEALAALQADGRDSLGAMLNFRLVDCDLEHGDFLYRCSTQKWMCNPEGLLHGGISATVADHAMGLTANAVLHTKGFAVTVDMNLSYHRPLMPEKEILVSVHVISETATLIRLRCEECCAEKPEKVCVSATSTFYIKAMA